MGEAKCEITERHCSHCGLTDYEDTAVTYSGCCNEPVVDGSDCDYEH